MLLDQIPEIILHTRVRDASIPGDNPFRWQDRSTRDIFEGKRSILFSLPAAFSPTCTDQHFPRYEALSDQFKSLGIDQTVCISVNDAFVMFQWGKKVGVNQVHLLPDGNAEFTRRMGMLVDRSAFGMGWRSWRLNDLVIASKMASTSDDRVSDADTMLKSSRSISDSHGSKPNHHSSR